MILLQIKDVLDMSNPLHITMWSLFLTSFFLMLRKSNVCYTPGTNKRFLLREHVSFKKNSVLINIFWTKTLQLGERMLQMPMFRLRGSQLCPVKALIKMFQAVPLSNNAALFSFTDGKPITYAYYQRFLKSCIQYIGLDKNCFSSHSFRRGAVSLAIKCGIPESMVKIMGDWKSECYKMYINCPLEVRCNFASMFAEPL